MLDRTPLARAQSREIRITFRATQVEAAELHADAAAEDLPLSWLIRRRNPEGENRYAPPPPNFGE